MVLYGACGLAYSQLAKVSLARWGEQGLARGGGALVALGLLSLSLAPGPGWAVLACPLAGWGFYMMHNTLQTQATQMAPEARSMAVTLFACTLFLGQTAGVALVALCLDAGGLQAALGIAAGAVLLLGLFMAKGLQPKALLSPP
jgi:predicted MFS family arabinose efflux permease